MGFATRVALGIALLVSASAQAAPSFTKIADQSTPVPGWTPGVEFGSPELDGGLLAFFAFDWVAGFQGIHTSTGGAVSTVVDSATLVPGGGGATFESLYGPSLSQGTVAFAGHAAGANPSVFTATGGALTLIADDTTPDPNGLGGLLIPDIGTPSIDGSNVTFRAFHEANRLGFFTSVGGVLETSADETTPIPGAGPGELTLSSDGLLDGTEVAFLGSQGGKFGVFAADAGIARILVDTDTPIPGGSGNFMGFNDDTLAFEDGDIVFQGGAGIGAFEIYAEIAGVLMQVSAGETFLGAASIDGDRVAYYANDASGDAIYLFENGVRERIVGTGDVLDGKTVNGLVFGRNGLSGDQLAFTTYFTDDTFAVYLVTIPEPGTAGLLAVGLMVLAGRRRRQRPAR